jgi:LemA protein
MNVLIILLTLVPALDLLMIVVFNRFVKNYNLVKDVWSNIDVALKRRHNLIPNPV